MREIRSDRIIHDVSEIGRHPHYDQETEAVGMVLSETAAQTR
jgi:hypothetical protein